jgi:hypothetical protein
MTHFESLTSPRHLYTRAEVLYKPSPVPSASGAYARQSCKALEKLLVLMRQGDAYRSRGRVPLILSG